jgi:hypothetical protein
MKRYSPLLFLGLTLLAKAFAHGYILSHPVVWPQAPVEHLPQSLEAFTFLSGPVCILIFLGLWKPIQQEGIMARARQRAGSVLLVATIFLWLFFIFQWLQAAWVVSTPTKYPLYWLEKYYRMYRFADVSLIVGGGLSLWLKGVRMPPRLNDTGKQS